MGLTEYARPCRLVPHRPISLRACPPAFLSSLPSRSATHDPLRAGAGPALWLGFWPWQARLLLLWGEGPATCCCDIGATGFLPLVAFTAEFLFSLASPASAAPAQRRVPVHTGFCPPRPGWPQPQETAGLGSSHFPLGRKSFVLW